MLLIKVLLSLFYFSKALLKILAILHNKLRRLQRQCLMFFLDYHSVKALIIIFFLLYVNIGHGVFIVTSELRPQLILSSLLLLVGVLISAGLRV